VISSVLFQAGIHRAAQTLFVTRLGQETKDMSVVDGRNCRFEIRLAGKYHAHRLRIIIADRGQQFGPVHAGHAHVRDHQSHRAGGFQQRQGFDAAGRRHNVIRLPQLAADAVQDIGLVVNKKYAH